MRAPGRGTPKAALVFADIVDDELNWSARVSVVVVVVDGKDEGLCDSVTELGVLSQQRVLFSPLSCLLSNHYNDVAVGVEWVSLGLGI